MNPIRVRVNAIRHRMHATRRGMHPIRVHVNAIPHRMHAMRRGIHPIRVRVNAIPHRMHATRRGMHPIRVRVSQLAVLFHLPISIDSLRAYVRESDVIARLVAEAKRLGWVEDFLELVQVEHDRRDLDLQ